MRTHLSAGRQCLINRQWATKENILLSTKNYKSVLVFPEVYKYGISSWNYGNQFCNISCCFYNLNNMKDENRFMGWLLLYVFHIAENKCISLHWMFRESSELQLSFNFRIWSSSLRPVWTQVLKYYGLIECDFWDNNAIFKVFFRQNGGEQEGLQNLGVWFFGWLVRLISTNPVLAVPYKHIDTLSQWKNETTATAFCQRGDCRMIF